MIGRTYLGVTTDCRATSTSHTWSYRRSVMTSTHLRRLLLSVSSTHALNMVRWHKNWSLQRAVNYLAFDIWINLGCFTALSSLKMPTLKIYLITISL